MSRLLHIALKSKWAYSSTTDEGEETRSKKKFALNFSVIVVLYRLGGACQKHDTGRVKKTDHARSKIEKGPGDG